MKLRKLFLLCTMLGVAMTGFTSCSDDDDDNPPAPKTEAEKQMEAVAAVLVQNSDLTVFNNALKNVDVSATQATSFTVFAFQNDVIMTPRASMPVKSPVKLEVMKRHIVAEAITMEKLAEKTEIKTLSGETLTINSHNNIVYLNGIGIKKTIGADKNIIFVMNDSIPPVPSNIPSEVIGTWAYDSISATVEASEKLVADAIETEITEFGGLSATIEAVLDATTLSFGKDGNFSISIGVESLLPQKRTEIAPIVVNGKYETSLGKLKFISIETIDLSILASEIDPEEVEEAVAALNQIFSALEIETSALEGTESFTGTVDVTHLFSDEEAIQEIIDKYEIKDVDASKVKVSSVKAGVTFMAKK